MSLKSYQAVQGDQDQEQALKLATQWANLMLPKVTLKSSASVINPFTAAEIIGALVVRSGATGAMADVLPTASSIVAALPNAAVGDAFVFWIRNGNTSSGAITVTTNTGLTLDGTMTIAISSIKMFMGRVTNVGTPAVTIYSLGATSAY